MARKPTDLSNKTLADIREMKASISANVRKAILYAVREEETAYGIRLADLDVRFGRNTCETECGEIIEDGPDCEVNVDIIGTEL